MQALHNGHFFSDFPDKILHAVLIPCAPHLHQSHPTCFLHPNNIRLEITKFLITEMVMYITKLM